MRNNITQATIILSLRRETAAREETIGLKRQVSGRRNKWKPQGCGPGIGNRRGANYFLIVHRQRKRDAVTSPKNNCLRLLFFPLYHRLSIIVLRYETNALPGDATREIPQLRITWWTWRRNNEERASKRGNVISMDFGHVVEQATSFLRAFNSINLYLVKGIIFERTIESYLCKQKDWWTKSNVLFSLKYL